METKHLTISSSMIAMGIILPFLTLNNPQLGQILLLMHLPVLIGAYFIKPKYAFLVGLIIPLLRGVLVGVPPVYPIGIVMAIELSVYGLCVSLIFKALNFKSQYVNVMLTLIISMIIGRVFYGIGASVFYNLAGDPQFSMKIFINSAFIVALPGILIQLVIVPAIVFAVIKGNHYLDEKK